MPPTRSGQLRRGTTPQRVRARLSRLALATAAVAIGVAWLGLPHSPGVDAMPVNVAWWLAVAFAACEAYALWMERRHAAPWGHTLSLVPLAVGLFYVAPWVLAGARVLGVAAVLAISRFRRPTEALYEVAVAALQTVAAALAYTWVLGDHGEIDVPAVLALLAGLLTSWTVGQLAEPVAVALAVGWPGWRTIGEGISSGAGAGVLNAAIGVGLAMALADHPHVILLLSAIVVSCLLSNRIYTGVAERHRRLEALHRFSSRIVRSVDLGEVGASVLEGARSLLLADHAALLLAPLSEGEHASRRMLGDDGITADEVPVADYLRDVRALVPRMMPCRVARESQPAWLARIGPTSTLAAPITDTDRRVTGVLVVSQAHRRMTGGFGDDHARHLGELADHASIAIENGVLFTRLAREAEARAHQALHDPLTGLPNRVRLNELLDEAIERTSAARGRLGLIVVDLDSFSQVVDAFGHQSGDELLRQACERLRGLVPDGAVVCRLGEKQFAIVLGAVEDTDAAVAAARRLVAGFDPPFQAEGVLLALGINVGVAVYPEHAIDVPSLVQRAHIAADAARRHRTGWEVYDPVHDPATPRRLALSADLREALETGELDVCFQPKVEMATGVVRGAEALVRWNHPRLGRVRPSEFITIAEHSGDIRTLTMLVMRSAVAQCREWRDLGLDLSVAVNLSARNLLDLHLVDDVAELIESLEVPPSSLTLEITESTVMSDWPRSVEVLGGLAELGVCLSCDDFGTGYSSLAHLRRLPIGEIKIDRSFVCGMAVDEGDRSIARWVLALGRDLGLRTVAEGVESRESWELLTSLGCDLAQGFIVCPPLTASQFGHWLDRRPPDELPLLEPRPVDLSPGSVEPASEPVGAAPIDLEAVAPRAGDLETIEAPPPGAGGVQTSGQG